MKYQTKSVAYRIILAGGLLTLACITTGFSPARLEAPTVPPADRHSLTHSHNDYDQPHPLYDALSLHLESVETDVWWDGNRFQISHYGVNSNGTLEDLYLDPLQKIVAEKGSVYGDGKPFYLWIEIKESDPAVVAPLVQVLDRYSMFTVFTDQGTVPGPITVVLTGDEKNKKRMVDHYPVRKACRDAEKFDDSDPAADSRWQWYAINWYDHFQWTGYGRMPEDQRLYLDYLVRMMHSKGRKLRIFGTPEEENLWNELLAADVDLIGSNELSRLKKFLTAGM